MFAQIKRYGIGTLWYGAFATAAATFVGHYPWFATYNGLNEMLPPPTDTAEKLLRQAFIGFCASVDASIDTSCIIRFRHRFRRVSARLASSLSNSSITL